MSDVSIFNSLADLSEVLQYFLKTQKDIRQMMGDPIFHSFEETRLNRLD